MIDEAASYGDAEVGTLTDIGNAIRLATRFEHDLRYVPTHGWLRYEGHRLVQLVGAPLDEGMALPDLIRGEINASSGADRAQGLVDWAKKSSTEARVRAALSLMSDMPIIRATPDMLDKNPLHLNTQVGVFDLVDGDVRETLAADLLTRSTRVAPAPPTMAPTWQRFLDQVLPSKDVQTFLQRAVGYSLTGLTREEVFFILYGSGQNGKSKLLSALSFAMGNYAHSFDPKLILTQKYEGHPTNIASLHGVRFAYSNEVDQGSHLDEGKVKAITGGDTITARFMRKDEFSWRPTHKLWFATNHLPIIKGTDKGMWRRVLVIPFDITVSDEERDNLLEEKLQAEARGILGWAIDGAVDYLQYGLCPPAEVLTASDHYKHEQDSTAQFLAECTQPAFGEMCGSGDIYLRYKRWCDENGTHFLTNTAFGRELTSRGYPSEAVWNGSIVKKMRKGLRLLEGAWL